jgi:3'(2'), 5'-bisphosphate nucleotidase
MEKIEMIEDTPDPAELLPAVLQIALHAGQAIMEVYEDLHHEVEYKLDDSPLTKADLTSHRIISDALAAISSNIPVLSEESTEIPFEVRRNWHSFWLVDPLDGTKEFLNRNGEFTVNIALMRGGTPILGVVYVPATDIAYFAVEGAGARKSERGIVKPIRALEKRSAAPKVVISRWHGNGVDQMHADLEKIGVDPSRCEFVPTGSSLKFCLIAEGSADLYLRNWPTMEWDTAAAQYVLEMAGGSVSDLEGNRLKYNKPVLRNPSFLASAARLISPPA